MSPGVDDLGLTDDGEVLSERVATAAGAVGVDTLAGEGGEPLDDVVAVVLAPDHGARLVAIKIVRGSGVVEVLPGGDGVVDECSEVAADVLSFETLGDTHKLRAM